MSHIPYLVLVAAPEDEPLSVAEVKDYLRIDGTAEDTLLASLITASRQAAEQFLSASLITQSWALKLDHYAPSRTKLPRGPVQEIISVVQVDNQGSETSVSDAAYRLNAGNDILQFDANPVAHHIVITYVTGYGDAASDVPAAIRQGMLCHVAVMYENRVGDIALPAQSIALYSSFRIIRV